MVNYRDCSKGMSFMYTIKEASEKLKVTIHTLRYYEKEGLTPFVEKDSKGIRRYTDRDIDWIYMIRCLRDTNMPIRVIREYISLFMKGDSTIVKRRELMKMYQAFVEDRVEKMGKCLIFINKKLECYDYAINDIGNGSKGNISLECSTYKDSWEQFKLNHERGEKKI